jgi:hypothetical protein
MAETTFGVNYDGPALEDGRMPVRELAPALLALGDLFKEAGGELYPDLPPPTLDVKATQRGSFDVHLVLTADGVWDQVVNMLTAKGSTALTNLEGLVIGGGSVGMGLFKFIKFLQKRKVKTAEAADDHDTMRIVLDDETTLEVPVGTLKLYRNKRVREAARDSVAPLRRSGIERVEFQPAVLDTEGGEAVTVERGDLDAFDSPEEAEDELLDEERKMVVTLVSVSFSEGNKWRVSDGQLTFGVTIDDEGFVDRVNRGEAFRKGDMLRCRMRIVQSTKDGKLHTEYRLTEVIEHIKSGEQLNLEDGPEIAEG